MNTTIALSAEEQAALRAQFPVLHKDIAFLDTAASAQKPQCVLDAVMRYYQEDYSNIHRGVYQLSQRSTALYEAARQEVQYFLNAAHAAEIVFTRGTTESLNLLAFSLGDLLLAPGDAVLISAMEHHANIVPWQQACARHQAELRVIPMNDKGELELEALKTLLDARVKIVSVCEVSNALGTVNPLPEIIRQARAACECAVIVDGAQAVAHQRVDVQSLDCDFYVFSGHKLYAPTGIGVLYGRSHFLERMPPFMTGGDMILSVSFEHTDFAAPPQKFEAGTPPIAQAIGLAAAIRWLQAIDLQRVKAHETMLLHSAHAALREIEGLRIIGTAAQQAGLVSFTLKGIHPHDIATVLDEHGVCVRAGHHCAQPVMQRFKLPATVRASFGVYNQQADIDRLVLALRSAIRLFH